MRCNIDTLPRYLRLEFVGRETIADARACVEVTLTELEKSGVTKVVIVVRESNPVFRVEQYGLSEVLTAFARIAGLRIAFVSDTAELFASHEYLALLAKQRGVDIGAFRDEASAVKWLLGGK